MTEEAQDRLAASCYYNTPAEELNGITLEDFTVALKAEWAAMGWV
jgi:hypothetical protein